MSVARLTSREGGWRIPRSRPLLGRQLTHDPLRFLRPLPHPSARRLLPICCPAEALRRRVEEDAVVRGDAIQHGVLAAFGWLPLVPIRMRRLTAERTARRRTADSAALPTPAASRIACKHVRSRVRHGTSAVARTLHLTTAVTRDSDRFLARWLEVDGLAAPVPASGPPWRPSPSWPPTSSPTCNLPPPARAHPAAGCPVRILGRRPPGRREHQDVRLLRARRAWPGAPGRRLSAARRDRPGLRLPKLHLGGGPVGR
jgi:hypothetical protein